MVKRIAERKEDGKMIRVERGEGEGTVDDLWCRPGDRWAEMRGDEGDVWRGRRVVGGGREASVDVGVEDGEIGRVDGIKKFLATFVVR